MYYLSLTLCSAYMSGGTEGLWLIVCTCAWEWCWSFLSYSVKNPRLNKLYDEETQESRGEGDSTSSSPGCFKSLATEETGSFSETKFQSLVSTNTVSDTSGGSCSVQDQPLSFDQTRLAVAAAAFRGPALHRSSSQTQNLARMLQSGLPNLSKFYSQQEVAFKTWDPEKNEGTPKSSVDKTEQSPVQDTSKCGAASDWRTAEVKNQHILGLDCYSSSDEDS